MPRIHGKTPNSIQRLTEVDSLIISQQCMFVFIFFVIEKK